MCLQLMPLAMQQACPAKNRQSPAASRPLWLETATNGSSNSHNSGSNNTSNNNSNSNNASPSLLFG